MGCLDDIQTTPKPLKKIGKKLKYIFMTILGTSWIIQNDELDRPCPIVTLFVWKIGTLNFEINHNSSHQFLLSKFGIDIFGSLDTMHFFILFFIYFFIDRFELSSHHISYWKLFWQISYCKDTLLKGVPNNC